MDDFITDNTNIMEDVKEDKIFNLPKKKICEFCGKDEGKYLISVVNKYCCHREISLCPSRNLLFPDYSKDVNPNSVRICDYCNEKRAYFQIKTHKDEIKWCCETNPNACRSKRKTNDYKLIKLLLGKSLLCDYGCNRAAKYIFVYGSVCCSSDVKNCPNIRNKRKTERRNRGIGVGKVIEKKCLCGCGLNVIKNSQKFFNRDHMKEYYKIHGWGINSHPCVWKGKKRPEHSKLIRERAHHFRGLKNPFSGLSKMTIEDVQKKYPIFSFIEEMRYNPDNPEEIQVHCKNHKCENSKEKNGWFTPKYWQFYSRCRVLDILEEDGQYFYCSDKCKEECPLYNVKTRSLVSQYKKQCEIIDNNEEILVDSLEYKLWRDEVFKRSNYKCEYCGAEAKHAHHMRPKKLEPFFELDPDYGVACCVECHYKKGHSGDCSTYKLGIKEC